MTNSKRSILRQIIIKLSKAEDKERILKATREVTHHIQGIFGKINR